VHAEEYLEIIGSLVERPENEANRGAKKKEECGKP
jgi:hypothetical protein